MDVPIDLTPPGQPVTLIQTGWFRNHDVIDLQDLSQYDALDLEVGHMGISDGGASPQFQVSLYTSMQNDVDDPAGIPSWFLVGQIDSFSSPATAPFFAMKAINMGLLRYLRLNVSAVTSFDANHDEASWSPAEETLSPPPNVPDVTLPPPATPYWYKATLRSGNTSGTSTPLGSFLRWQVQGTGQVATVTFVIWGIGRTGVPAT